MALGINYPDGPKFFVDVTAEMIAEAVRGNSSHCMISEAIKDARPEAMWVSTDLQTIRFTDRERGLRFTYLTPRKAQLALLNFDQGIDPEPFRFRLGQAQVTASGNPKNRPDKLRKAKIVQPHGQANAGGNVARRVGGSTAPLGALSDTKKRPSKKTDAAPITAGQRTGKRREFGLRAMG